MSSINIPKIPKKLQLTYTEACFKRQLLRRSKCRSIYYKYCLIKYQEGFYGSKYKQTPKISILKSKSQDQSIQQFIDLAFINDKITSIKLNSLDRHFQFPILSSTKLVRHIKNIEYQILLIAQENDNKTNLRCPQFPKNALRGLVEPIKCINLGSLAIQHIHRIYFRGYLVTLKNNYQKLLGKAPKIALNSNNNKNTLSSQMVSIEIDLLHILKTPSVFLKWVFSSPYLVKVTLSNLNLINEDTILTFFQNNRTIRHINLKQLSGDMSNLCLFLLKNRKEYTSLKIEQNLNGNQREPNSQNFLNQLEKISTNSPVKKHKVSRYNTKESLLFNLDGKCDHSQEPKKQVIINRNFSPKDYLNTGINLRKLSLFTLYWLLILSYQYSQYTGEVLETHVGILSCIPLVCMILHTFIKIYMEGIIALYVLIKALYFVLLTPLFSMSFSQIFKFFFWNVFHGNFILYAYSINWKVVLLSEQKFVILLALLPSLAIGFILSLVFGVLILFMSWLEKFKN